MNPIAGSSIAYASYELKFRGLGALPVRHGALLQVDGGFADLHPWPELGDLSLEEELAAIRAGQPTPLGHKSLQFAGIDREARSAKRRLLDGLALPTNHLHVGRWNQHLGFADLERRIADSGYTRLKVKFGDFFDPREFAEFKKLIEFTRRFEGVKLRLDFNYAFGERSADFEDFFSTLSESELDQVDFIEDPFLFEDGAWIRLQERFQCRFALDRGDFEIKTEVDERLDQGTPPFAVVVVKPALEDADAIVRAAAAQMRRVVFTSYLDHPVGQVTAAYEASRLFSHHPLLFEDCGLLSHVAYETHAFSEALRIDGTRLVGASGNGWGFDELLARQEWKKLT